jgi:NAD(P)-dependent dehydrogenase (short-subunit alcohol dehydrogenase family)
MVGRVRKGASKMELFNLTGKTAVITGASSGLGEQFARCLAEAGARVILVARRITKLQALANSLDNAVQNGTSLQELQQLGGWASFEMVLRYAHLSSDHLRDAAERVSDTKVSHGNVALETKVS